MSNHSAVGSTRFTRHFDLTLYRAYETGTRLCHVLRAVNRNLLGREKHD